MHFETFSDEELMAAYQGGEAEAFAVLYRRHSAKIFGYLVGRLRDRGLAEDVFQAVFLKLHASRSHYDPSFPFVPWLFTVCRSVLVDAVRKRGRSLEEADDATVREAVDPRSLAGIDATSGTGGLEGAGDLSSLPPVQRQVLNLRYSEGLSFDEIARRLDTSPVNARQLVSRAIRRLRAKTGSDGGKT